MTVITLNSPIAPGNFINTPNAKKGEYLEFMGFKIVHALGYAEIDSVGGISFPVRLAPDEYLPNSAGNQITIPTGAMVIRSAFRVPTGITATDGDTLTFAGGATDANTAGTHVAVESGIAASSTFATASYVSQAPIGAYLGVISANTALAADLALNVISVTPGSPDDGPGNTMTATKTVYIPCEIVYAVANTDAPLLADVYPQSKGRTDITTS